MACFIYSCVMYRYCEQWLNTVDIKVSQWLSVAGGFQQLIIIHVCSCSKKIVIFTKSILCVVLKSFV
jgi:hypothetical protein